MFAKVGAEGVMVMTAPNGTTTALKVLDGSSRASTIIALRLLADAGALEDAAVDAVQTELDLWVMGGERRVGEIRATRLSARRSRDRPTTTTDAARERSRRGIRRSLGSGQPSFASRFARAARETCAPTTSTIAKRNTAEAMTFASAGMPREAEM